MTRKKKIVWGVVGLAAILFVLFIVVSVRSAIAMSKIAVIQTELVERTDLTQIVEASGRINPVTDVEISANVSAEIAELPVKEGDFVKKGDLLVVLDQTRYVAAIEQAEAAVRSASANAELARANLEQAEKKRTRTGKLLKQNLASEEAYELVDTQYKVSKATHEAARETVAQTRAVLDQTRDEFSKTKIESPMDGTVSRLDKEVGEIAVGSTFTKDVIMVVADLTEMEMVAEVDENDIPDVRVGQIVRIEVDALPDTPFTGTVRDIARSATVQTLVSQQEQSTDFDVRISVDGDVSAVRPGMSATAEIEVAYRKDVLAVPIQCITMRDPTKTGDEARNLSRIREEDLKEVLFTVAKDASPAAEAGCGGEAAKKAPVFGAVKMVPIETGISSDTHIEITGEVEPGTEVASGPFKVLNKTLVDGDKVRINNADDLSENDE